MYCTGGIRCERATALLNQMTEAEDQGGFQTKDVVMARGGIERYLKSYPEGGYWKGKNYLFDKRMEQVPSLKTSDALDNDIESECCICSRPYASYRGQFKCSLRDTCSVPVIVCPRCTAIAEKDAENDVSVLICPLCKEGHARPTTAPDLIGQKRRLGVIEGGKDSVSGVLLETKKQRRNDIDVAPSRRIFVGNLTLLTTASILRAGIDCCAAAGERQCNGGGGGGGGSGGGQESMVETIHWIVDHKTGAFFGSAFVYMSSVEAAKRVVRNVQNKLPLILCGTVKKTIREITRRSGGGGGGSRTNKRKHRHSLPIVRFAAVMKQGTTWPSVGHEEMEFPPR